MYQTVQAVDMMVAGGRDSDVGSGELVLGGGYSWFTSTMVSLPTVWPTSSS